MAKKQETVLAAVSYVLGILTGIIVFLVSEKNDRYTKFHAVQSIFFHVSIIIIFWVLGILLLPFGMSPLMMPMAYVIVLPMLGLAAFVIWIVLIIKAYNGVKFKLPVIGELAENLTKK